MIEFDEHVPEKRWLDLTPMIDVVFLLLIFFLLTSIFSQPSIPLDLPKAKNARLQEEQEVTVSVRRDGTLLLNNVELTLAELAPALRMKYSGYEQRGLNLRSDRGVPFGRVVEVMDVAKQAGAEAISVVTEKKS